MKKRYIFLVVALILGSFVCFLRPSFHASGDWVLFLLLFSMSGVILGVQRRGVLSRKLTLTSRFFRERSEGDQRGSSILGKITERFKEREELLDALQEGVILLNAEGEIVTINRQAAHLFGGEKGEFLGRGLFELELMKGHQKLWNRCRKTGQRQSEVFCLDGEGKKCFDIEIKLLGNGGKFIVTLRSSLRQYQKHQLGKDFVANASHELRTPITIIKGFAETIHDLPEISNAMLQDFTGKIIRNCQRMDNLVKNLLILADLDSLPMVRFQECDVVALIDNCSHTLLALHPEVSIEALQNREIITIPADPDLLELAFMNLLENGVKYSKGAPLITITIEDFPEEVRLTIADRGMGIVKEDLDRIFERFYTVNKAHSRKLGGAGLGLSIVKAIITKHEGSICVNSGEGGTEFCMAFQKVTQSVL